MYRTIKKDGAGVSPVIAVILMVAITVVLSGVVFLWANSFTDQAGSGLNSLSVEIELTSAVTGATLSITSLRNGITWSDYRVLFDEGETTEPSGFTGVGEPAMITIPDGIYYAGSHHNVKIIDLTSVQVVIDRNIICKSP